MAPGVEKEPHEGHEGDEHSPQVNRAAQRFWRSAAWHRPPTVAEALGGDARRLPDLVRKALCHVSCSALGGADLRPRESRSPGPTVQRERQ